MNIIAKIRHRQLQASQVLVLGFLSVIFIGAIILSTPFVTQSGESIGFVNAFFTATSAVCVTGLVVVDTGSFWNYFGKTVIIILIQIGGLGFMTMASLLTIMAGKKFSLKNRIMMQESMGAYHLSGIVRLTKYAVRMTFILEFIGAFVLSFRFVPMYGHAKGIYYSVFHSISAFCNAGFDIMGTGDSLSRFVKDPLVSITISLLVIFGGLGFMVVLEIFKFKKFRHWTLNTKLVVLTTLTLLIIPFIIIFILEYNNPNTMVGFSLGEKFIATFFATMTPRTAGFNTIDIVSMRPAVLVITMILMFIGGSPSSTAGGVKTTTVSLFVITILSILRGKKDVEAFGRRIPAENAKRAIAVIGIALLFIIIIITSLSITEQGASFFEIVFETLSAYGTVGLSVGLSGKLTTIGKLIMSLAMFLGRVGALTLLFAATSKYKSNQNLMISYPSEQISIG